MYLLEPEEELRCESWEDEKFDESKYRKKGWRSKFTERFRILKETNPEILPVYPVQNRNQHRRGGRQTTAIH